MSRMPIERGDREVSESDLAGRLADLTRRELQVLALIARARSNREIVEELYLSSNTLKTHIRSVYAKIGVSSRSQAIIVAHEHGLVD